MDTCKTDKKELCDRNDRKKPCCSNDREALLKGRNMINNILTKGSDVELETGPILLPPWYDHDLISRGQLYFKDNLFNMFVAALCGLVSLLSIPSINQLLRRTNKSSKPSTAYKRYLGTILHMISWYESDLRNPNSKGRQSIAVVRKMHENAMKNFSSPITQKDIALTQFAFVGIAISSKDKLGLPNDQKGLIHFWRLIGHLIGIQERFNLFNGCEKCVNVACKEMSTEIFASELDKHNENFKPMSRALLNGIWPIIPFVIPSAFTEFTRRILNCSPKSIKTIPTIALYSQLIVHYLLKIPIISLILLPCLNFQMWLAIFLQNTVPILAFYAYRYSWWEEIEIR